MWSHFILSAMLTPLKEELQGRMWERSALRGSFQLIFWRATSKPCVICMQWKQERLLRYWKGFLTLFQELGLRKKIKCLHFLTRHLSKLYFGDFVVLRVQFYNVDQRQFLSMVLIYTVGSFTEFPLSKQGESANRWKHTSPRTSSICNKKYRHIIYFQTLWTPLYSLVINMNFSKFISIFKYNIFVGSWMAEWSHISQPNPIVYFDHWSDVTKYHNKEQFSEIWGLSHRHLCYENASQLTLILTPVCCYLSGSYTCLEHPSVVNIEVSS